MSDLNRRVAEALGYTVTQIDDIGIEPVILMYPHGEDEFSGVELPDWEHDLNAAWRDLTPDLRKAGYTIAIDDQRMMISHSEVLLERFDWTDNDLSQPETIARLICEAWLQWKEAEAGNVNP